LDVVEAVTSGGMSDRGVQGDGSQVIDVVESDEDGQVPVVVYSGFDAFVNEWLIAASFRHVNGQGTAARPNSGD
jgi:hypothetical protein